ncbi:MAG: hypothetical protein AABX88_01510 [Nanoarchaeota archaeon]
MDDESKSIEIHIVREPIKPEVYYKNVEELVLDGHFEPDVIIKPGTKSSEYAGWSMELSKELCGKICIKNGDYAVVEIRDNIPRLCKYKLSDLVKI